jgi:hypothetical protein
MYTYGSIAVLIPIPLLALTAAVTVAITAIAVTVGLVAHWWSTVYGFLCWC